MANGYSMYCMVTKSGYMVTVPFETRLLGDFKELAHGKAYHQYKIPERVHEEVNDLMVELFGVWSESLGVDITSEEAVKGESI